MRLASCLLEAKDLKLTANRHVVGVLRGLFFIEETYAVFRVATQTLQDMTSS